MTPSQIFHKLVQALLDRHLTLGVAIKDPVAAAITEAYEVGYRTGYKNATREAKW